MQKVKRDGLYPASVQPGIPRRGKCPSGWQVVRLEDCVKPIKRPCKLKPDAKYRLIVAKRNRVGIELRSEVKGINIKTPTQFYVCAGDFLISRRQIVHGACGIVPEILDGAIVSNEYSALVTRANLIDMQFLAYMSHTIYFQQICFHSSIGIHVEKMIFNLENWLKCKINLPPIEIQKKIAKILFRWDRAIEKTEELIEKKQRQQNGLMQKLLTVKTRLKQFKASPPWLSTSLGSIAQILFSTVDKKTVPGQNIVKLCNYMDAYNNNYITNELPFMLATASEAEIARYSLKKHDVIITKDSETPEDIASTAVVTEELKNVICGYHLGIIRSDSRKVYGPFLAKLLSYGRTHWQFVISANGATRFGLGIDDTKNVMFKMPAIEEQRAIFEILLSLDREMEMLSRKVEFLQKEKKALLNVLMSGKMTISQESL